MASGIVTPPIRSWPRSIRTGYMFVRPEGKRVRPPAPHPLRPYIYALPTLERWASGRKAMGPRCRFEALYNRRPRALPQGRPSGAARAVLDLADPLGLRALGGVSNLELNLLALFERLVAISLDGGVVDENVGAVLPRDESIALCVVEPLHPTLHHDCVPPCARARTRRSAPLS